MKHLLWICLLLTGCQTSSFPTADIIPVVHAQTPAFPPCANQDFNVGNSDIHGEGVCNIAGSPNAFTLMAEAVWYPTKQEYASRSLPLHFPAGRTIKELNGILTYYSDCPWQPPSYGNVALTRIFTSSNQPTAAYTWSIKSGQGQGQSVSIHSTVAVNTGDGNGQFIVYVATPAGCMLTLEFQGQMEID